MCKRILNPTNIIVGVVVLVAIGALIMRLLGQPIISRPTATPIGGGGGLIAFESERDGNREIYVMNADGTNQTNLTNNPADDISPTWSPDGTRIAFLSERTGRPEVFLMNANGSGVTQLTTDPDASWEAPLAWLPDGTRVAAGSITEGFPQIHLISIDGTGNTPLVPNQYGDVQKWAPDGKHLAFRGLHGQIPALYVVRADGTGLVNIIEGESNNNQYNKYLGFDWSPDGTQLAYLSNGPWSGSQIVSGFHVQIKLTNLDGSERREIFNLRPAPNVLHGLTWSPDGSYLMFVALTGNDCRAVHLLQVDGSGFTRLNGICYVSRTSEPDWSMDSQWVVFTADPKRAENGNTEIYAINIKEALRSPDNVRPIPLTNSPGLDLNPQWQPTIR